MEETVLLLLSFICVSCWCQAVVHHLGHHTASSPCKIQHPLETSLVMAYLERPVRATGCSSDILTSAGAEVHVLLYHGTKQKQTVELYLQNHGNKGTIPPFYIYLSSDSDVIWKVHMKGDPIPGSHKFEINRGSRLKFVKKRIKSSPFVTHRKENALPHEKSSLLTQISQKHQDIVTSFSELQGGSTINLSLGKASNTDVDKSCGQIDIQQSTGSNLSISALDLSTQHVDGCLVNPRETRHGLYKGMRKAYVVELKDVPADSHFEVNLELKRQSGHVVDEDFWLVLKSPNHISWRVYTRRLKGSINIAANSFVDMSDIRMEPVAIRSEELRDSGVELLRWVEHYLGPVAMYTAMNNSNLIKITLPEVVPEIVEPSKPKESEQSVLQIKYALKRSISTKCDENSLMVAIGKKILQALKIKSSAISLIDSQCTAIENSTHVYILTSAHGCGTNYLMQQGRKTYVNVLVIHSSNTIEEMGGGRDIDTLEEEGSGLDVFSGSGEQPADLTLDDEDLNLKPLQLSLSCSFKAEPSHPVVPIVEFELTLFQTEQFLLPYAHYPLDIRDIHSRLYLQASLVSPSHLRAHIEHCWLSHDTDNNSRRHALVSNGCKSDNSVTWHSVPKQSGTQPLTERMSFTLENYVKQTTSHKIYVMCEMSVCCVDGFCHSSNHPHCEARSSDCDPRKHRLANPPHRVVIIGPISLPQQQIHYTDITTDETSVNHPSHMDGKTKEKQDHVVIEGLDSGTVVGIAFAAFIIGVLMMGALWFIHTHSGSIFTSGPFKRGQGSRGSPDNEGETTPGSSAPISA